jgi:integrase
MGQTSFPIEEVLSYLLELQSGEPKMTGTIRTEEKCPICRSSFTHIPKIGFRCPVHKLSPSKVFIDIGWKGKRYRIFSDKQGQVLDSYQRAWNILGGINTEIESHRFDPSRYVLMDQKRFIFDNLIKTWIENKEKEVGKGTLADSYVSKLKIYEKKYISPFFAGKDVRDIRAFDIKEFYRSLPDNLSPKYLKNILNGLENFFNLLTEDEYIERKPVFPTISVPEPATNWCDQEAQDKILEAIPEKHRPIFFFLTRQGLRPAEAGALKWRDIDLKNGIVTPQRTFSNRKIVERTKGKSIRPRLLNPEILEVLKTMPRGLPEVFLFVNPNNKKPYQNYTLERIWKDACKKAEMNITLYEATRHSVASMAAVSGVPINIIKEALGQADIRTTMRYSHLHVLSQRQVFLAQKGSVTAVARQQGQKS